VKKLRRKKTRVENLRTKNVGREKKVKIKTGHKKCSDKKIRQKSLDKKNLGEKIRQKS